MDKPTSIYSKQNPKIVELFKASGGPEKVLCVAMDYAKSAHVILFCNGSGEILRPSFPVDNSKAGLEQLLEHLGATCRRHRIKPKHVFFGGEDNPSYAQNFIEALGRKGYLVLRVNAWEAKHQRDNHQASTDRLDVLAIAKTLLHKRAYCDQDCGPQYLALKEISRARSSFVVDATDKKLHIHRYVSELFPQFLEAPKSGIAPFGTVSLRLMSQKFSALEMATRPAQRTVKLLQSLGLVHAQEAAEKLKSLATQALPTNEHLRLIWQSSLRQYVLQLQSLDQSILELEKALAQSLAKTKGAFLTSISGIGVVLAAGIVGEAGDPNHWPGVRSLCAYGGVVPRVGQTGGPEQPAQIGTVPKRCNRRLKNWIVRGGNKMGECGPPELQQDYHQLQEAGQHADFIMSKRLLRISKDIMLRGTVYRPKALLAADTAPELLVAYYRQLWPRLLDKWQGLILWEELFQPDYPLGQWRQMVQKLYSISLPLPKQRAGKAS